MDNNIKLLQGVQGGGFLEKSSPEQRLNRLFNQPNKTDILYFLKTTVKADLDALYSFSNRIRQEHVGGAIYLRAIIEFSNYCSRECRYCGLFCSNHQPHRYRMPPAVIVSAAANAYKKGYRTVVLQSGDSCAYTPEEFADVIRAIKKNPGLAVTLSIGEKSEEEYKTYFEAGANRFLLKHETSNPQLFQWLKPGRRLENRLEALRLLKKIGYQIGSGIMIGLPGQSIESIANDILLFLELKVDMIGCGPFIPHPDTPLGGEKPGSEDLTYRVLAINRIVMPQVHLPVTTALSCLDESGARKKGLQRGGNVIMPNLTPARYRRYYEIYPNKKRLEVNSGEFKKELEELAASLGRFII